MNESKAQNWALRRGVVAIAVYALNALIIAASYADIGRAMARALKWPGIDSWELSRVAFAILLGLVLGQLGCVALWFCLSNRSAILKFPIFVLSVAQIAGVFALVMVCMDGGGPLSYYQFLLILSVLLALITSFALWLSSSRLSIVPLDQLTTKTRVGISISQVVLATTLVAIVVGIISRGPLPSGSLRRVFIVIVVGALVGLLPSVGLVVGLSLRWFSIQLVVCAIVGLTLGSGFTASEGWTVEHLFESTFAFASIILMPVIWIRVIRYLGYDIQSVDRTSLLKDDHPFVEQDVAKEASV